MEAFFNEISVQRSMVYMPAMAPPRIATQQRKQEWSLGKLAMFEAWQGHDGNPYVWMKQEEKGKITEQSVLSGI